MSVQNIKHSYIVVSSKYTNFVSFFFLVRRGTCLWYNTNLRSKIRDANKCDTAAHLYPSHNKHNMLFLKLI